MDELVKYLRALVHLQIQASLEERDRLKTEVLLGRAGFKHAEIAHLLGKTPAAVAKAISRAS